VTRTECDHCGETFDPDGPHVEVFDYVIADDQEPDADPIEVREIGLDFCSTACHLAFAFGRASEEIIAGLDKL
jgi:hypothetical protein